MHDNHGDGVKVEKCSTVNFNNNKLERLGHEGFFAVNTSGMEAYSNVINCRTSSGIRLCRTNNVKIHDNNIYAGSEYCGPGIEIENNGTVVMNKIDIYNNNVHDVYGPGIWMIVNTTKTYPKSYATNVHIYKNTFKNCGKNPGIDWVGGIVTNGWDQTLIENNVIDGCYGSAVSHNNPTTGVDRGSTVGVSVPGSGYKTILKNNTIKIQKVILRVERVMVSITKSARTYSIYTITLSLTIPVETLTV
jgi:hypothetical protein